MNKLSFTKSYRFFSLITLIMLLISNLSAKKLEVLTTQLVLTGGEHISGKHFKCEGQRPYLALVVAGDNVTIEDSLFTGCSASIIISGAKNTTIKGNRFEDVGLAIRERRNEYGTLTKGTSIIFNEFRGVGVHNCLEAPEWLDGPGHNYWACDVFIANHYSSFGKFNNNLIDNRGKITRYIEDIINIGDGTNNYEVKDNIIIGSSEAKSSSGTGACIVIDTDGSNFTISGNQCYNAATSGISNAGGNNLIVKDNLVYVTKEHALGTWNHPTRTGPFRGDTVGLASSSYSTRKCGKNARFINNKVYAYYVDYDNNGNLRDVGTTHNWEDGYGRCESSSSLEGNKFHTTDPQWRISNNIFSNLTGQYYSSQLTAVLTTTTNIVSTPTTSTTSNAIELIKGGGNDNGTLLSSKWSFYGLTYGARSRTYKGESFIYSTSRDVGSGMYQSFKTEVGKTYRVSAILIGSDTNRKEKFNGSSYITIGSANPTQNDPSILTQSENISGGEEVTVNFTFTATTNRTYLSLRSDGKYRYASARAISVKKQ